MPGHLVRQFHVRQFNAWTFRWSVIFSAPRPRVAADAHRKHQKTHVTLTFD